MKEITDKYSQIHRISSPKPVDPQKGGIEPDNGFSQILTQQLGAAGQLEPLGQASPSAPQAGGLPEIQGSFRAEMLQAAMDTVTPAATDPTVLAKKVSDSIDLLETYAQWLQDPAKTLKQAFGLLETLAEQANQADQDISRQPEADPRLKDVITHLRTLVRVEQIKIDRGDYSSAL